MFEFTILGIIQGIAEWLPVSSEGAIVLTQVTFFDSVNFDQIIQTALWLHLGTFLAALVYFWKDVVRILGSLFHYKQAPVEQQYLVRFLIISTLISGVLGYALISVLASVFDQFESSARVIVIAVGVLLLVTAYLQFRAKHGGTRQLSQLSVSDSVLLGLVQGFAALPGLSRSGLTVSALLIRGFDKELALRVSFIMSLPIVFAGNIILQWSNPNFSPEALVGLLFSFIFGLATIHGLIKLAEKINFAYFILFFALLTFISAFI